MTPRWKAIGRALMVLFLLLVAALLVRYARSVNWRAVGAAITSYDRWLITGALALAAVSYTLYSLQDVLARAYTGHHVPKRRAMAIGIISYAMNLNLGAMVGSAGFRYRLYSQSGLRASTIARIIGFCIATNWSGYVLLAGLVFGTRHVTVPPEWSMSVIALQIVGVLLLLCTAAYFVACALWHDRVWRVRGHEIRLPPLRLAVLQITVSTTNWLVIATVLYLLVQRQVELTTMLGVLLLAAVGGAIAHIPAGLGVLELVTLAMLGYRIPEPTLLAALLAYRAIYYLAPLMVALVMYLRFEAIFGVRARAT